MRSKCGIKGTPFHRLGSRDGYSRRPSVYKIDAIEAIVNSMSHCFYFLANDDKLGFLKPCIPMSTTLRFLSHPLIRERENHSVVRGCSSHGRALALHARGFYHFRRNKKLAIPDCLSSIHFFSRLAFGLFYLDPHNELVLMVDRLSWS
ncbi:hypothetical protein SUGI_0606410 [Cryptomeria japonica]|nr:hypothetical protein SUGI_0606410 [Cryptomeria japonica]